MTGGARGTIPQTRLAECHAVRAFKKALHESIALLGADLTEMARTAGLRLIQRMRFGMNVAALHNFVRSVTRDTADCSAVLAGSSVIMHTAIELLLGFVMTSCAIDFSQFLGVREILD
jgi:hypothetical protein